MRSLKGSLVAAAALALAVGQAEAADPVPPRTAPLVVRPAPPGRVVRPVAAPRSNLDPLRGPVAINPGAYPADALELQPRHTWKGYAEN